MFKISSYLVPKAGMKVEAFRDYWLNTHGPLAAKLPGLISYHICFIDSDAALTTPNGGKVAGYAVLEFADAAAMAAAFASPEGQATAADIKIFTQETLRVSLTDNKVV